MGHGHIPVETLSDYGTNASANVSKLSVAWLIMKMLWRIRRISIFCLFSSTSFGGGSLD